VNRIDVINGLIRARGYKRYLEIGCHLDACFSAVEAAEKVGVDPVSGGTLRMKSDEFFDRNVDTFDVVFIDGYHHHDQAWRDIRGSLAILNPGGAIVMHDCLPPDAAHEALDLCGTVWRAFAKARCLPDLEAFTGAFDYGVGIIRRRRNVLPIRIDATMDQLNYDHFLANRELWMRPHSAAAVTQLISMPNSDWSQ
jgi:hypothetical protein